MGVVYRIPAYTDTLLPILPKTICIGQMRSWNNVLSARGKRQNSSFIHYPDGEMEELTASPLYHTVTYIINSNIHSGGVSLQQTKGKNYYIPKSTFFPEIGIIT